MAEEYGASMSKFARRFLAECAVASGLRLDGKDGAARFGAGAARLRRSVESAADLDQGCGGKRAIRALRLTAERIQHLLSFPVASMANTVPEPLTPPNSVVP